ncbi:MAG: sugar phosphate isomerase/epimerase [Candidatus Bathyarchaeota archaeon]|nr:sugar phosphate isomerase/epimerase [Candidatus Bathyarchaeota archaeon]
MATAEIGLSMLYCLGEPFSSMTKRLCKLDVKHVELPDEGLHRLNARRVTKLKQIAKTYDLDYVVHAPWAGINIATPDPSLRRTTLKRLEKSLMLSKQLGCRLWLFHPGAMSALSHVYPQQDWQDNLESVRYLLKLARQQGVNIAIENVPEPFPFLMKTVQDFHRFYQDLGEDIGMVLDVAHAHISNQIQDFVTQFSKKIVHIHASDNNGTQDRHQGVGCGTVDWKSFAKQVKDAKYSNLIMIESIDHVDESVQYLRNIF